MVSIPKTVILMSCGFLLCLGLSQAAQADNAAAVNDEMKVDQSDRRQGGQEAGEQQLKDPMKGSDAKGGKTIKGEVLRIEGDIYVIKGQDGKEVRLFTDKTTQMAKNIEPGYHIEAKVNDRNHALSILSEQAETDRRNAKD
ncbi:MAG: hypothetical protein ABIU05_03575 [Nitrospirales bacterium]